MRRGFDVVGEDIGVRDGTPRIERTTDRDRVPTGGVSSAAERPVNSRVPSSRCSRDCGAGNRGAQDCAGRRRVKVKDGQCLR